MEQGVLENDWVLIFDRMRNLRHTDSYSFRIHPTSGEVESGIGIAVEFIDRMEKLLNKT